MFASISNQFTKASFKTKGAELCSLINNQKEFIWSGNTAFWGKHSPILFPIVGRLKNDSFSINNQQYQLSRHGFARDLEFEINSQTENCIVFSLVANAETILKYPFDFELQIKYELVNKKLNISYLVKNNSNEKMPFSIGAHPAFALSNGFEKYSLTFSDDDLLEYYLLENGLISKETNKILLENKKLPLAYSTFEKDALVIKKLNSKSIIILDKKEPFIKINFDGFPNLGIWTVQNADFICIEPWFGFSDTNTSNGNLFEKEGIIILDKNESFNANYSIEIL